MDIEISCRSFEAEGSYSNNYVTLTLNNIDFGGNSKEINNEFLRDCFTIDNVEETFDASEITGKYDSYELLSNIGDDTILDYVKECIDSSNIIDMVDESVLEAYAKQYIRDKKIEGLVE